MFEVDPAETLNITAVRSSSLKICKDKRSSISVRSYVKKPNSSKVKKAERIVVAENGDQAYVGRNFGDANSFATEWCNYYVGIQDKKTGKIRVVPLDLVDLCPAFADSTDDESKVVEKTEVEKKDDLIKTFGSHKSKVALRRRTDQKLDHDSLLNTTKTVLDTSKLDTSHNDSISVVSTSSVVPPHDKDAKTPDEVYKISDLVPSLVLESLKTEADVFCDCTEENIKEWEEEKKYSKYVCNRLRSLPSRQDARYIKCQLLAYLVCLEKTYKIPLAKRRAKDPLPSEWNGSLKNHILSNFREETYSKKGTSRNFPSHLRDLMMSHMLILCLTLSEFVLNLTLLQQSFDLTVRRLSIHCELLGCHVARAKVDGKLCNTATLKIPVKFPEPRQKRKSNKLK